MNLEQFRNIVSWIHRTVDTAHFSLEDCIKVFDLYFRIYEDFTGQGHPIPSYRQIQDIMEKMPFADEEQKIQLEPEDYEALIPAYFLVQFPNCDYRISHFFSGEIRKNRYYETLY